MASITIPAPEPVYAFAQILKPYSSVTSNITAKQLELFIEQKSKDSVFNFTSPIVDTCHSIKPTTAREALDIKQIVAENDQYVTPVHFEVPTIYDEKVKDLLRDAGQILGAPSLDKLPDISKIIFNPAHPHRQTLPHSGPGIATLAKASLDTAYVRVAGLISQLTYEYLLMPLPRWLPVLIDIQYYINHLNSLSLVDEPNRLRLIKIWSLHFAALVSFIDKTVVKGCDLATAMKSIKQQRMQHQEKLGISLRMAVDLRAQEELEGNGGKIYLAIIDTITSLKKHVDRKAYKALLLIFNQLYASIASETISYAKANQVARFMLPAGSFGKTYCVVQSNLEKLRIARDHLKPAPPGQEVVIFTGIGEPLIQDMSKTVMAIKHDIFPRVEHLAHADLKLDIVLVPAIHRDTYGNGMFARVRKLDRTAFTKSQINVLHNNSNRHAIEVKTKMNGFQYQLRYCASTGEYQTLARYPYAPQLLFKTNSIYDFDINVEIAPNLDKSLELRLISARDFQGLSFMESENHTVLNKLQSFMKTNIRSFVNWPYNKPDGLIVTLSDDETHYYKKNYSADVLYNLDEDRLGVFTLNKVDENYVYTEHLWPSIILRQHAKGKPDTYARTMRNLAQLIVDDFKTKEPVVNHNALRLDAGSQIFFDDPGPDFPVLVDCYNLCLSYQQPVFERLTICERATEQLVDEVNVLFSTSELVLVGDFDGLIRSKLGDGSDVMNE